jgi:hypothetical protein
MTATPIGTTQRYIPDGTRQYYWVSSIASKSAPTRAELNAGHDLTGEIAEVSGFTVSTDMVDAPDLGTRFTSQISGRIKAADSSITLYLSDDSNDARSLLTRDLKGFVVQFPEGDDDGVSGTLTCDVFPATIASASKTTKMGDPGQLEVSFTITSEPATDVLVPA